MFELIMYKRNHDGTKSSKKVYFASSKAKDIATKFVRIVRTRKGK